MTETEQKIKDFISLVESSNPDISPFYELIDQELGRLNKQLFYLEYITREREKQGRKKKTVAYECLQNRFEKLIPNLIKEEPNKFYFPSLLSDAIGEGSKIYFDDQRAYFYLGMTFTNGALEGLILKKGCIPNEFMSESKTLTIPLLTTAQNINYTRCFVLSLKKAFSIIAQRPKGEMEKSLFDRLLMALFLEIYIKASHAQEELRKKEGQRDWGISSQKDNPNSRENRFNNELLPHLAPWMSDPKKRNVIREKLGIKDYDSIDAYLNLYREHLKKQKKNDSGN